MNYRSYLDIHSLQSKLRKVCRQIESLLQTGKKNSSEKIALLVKRCERYAKQLLLQPVTALKAGSILLFASVVGITSYAQSNTYVRADSANPVRRAGLPQGLWQPTFVDIDGDGDLDCYETSPNSGFGYGGSNRVQITLLRNTGTQQAPYYVQDAANGFPANLSIRAPEYQNVTRLQFADIDSDGDYDCFVAGYYKYSGYSILVKYFKNTGTTTTPRFINTPAENPFASLDFFIYLSYSLADIDQDGDLDLIAPDVSGAKVYKNTGTRSNPKFTLFSNLNGITSPQFFAYDYNKDERTDIFNGFIGVNGDKGVTYYRNTGNRNQLKFVTDKKNAPQLFIDDFTSYTFADLNNDGVAEAFSVKGNYAVATPVASITKLPMPPCGDAGCDPDLFATMMASPSGSSYNYQWYLDNKPIPGATNSSYSTYVLGSYSVAVTNSYGTGISLPFVLNADNYNDKLVTPFASLYNTASIKAYPNPFTSQFTLVLSKNNTTNPIIKITDLQGRIVSVVKVTNTVTQLGSNLQKGVYIVEVIQNNMTVFKQKITKQ